MTGETPIKQRLRITFGKMGALKYTSNLDIAKVWERVLRRADLPILYTQGFNARPRIQLALALPLGITSECEILDVSLREEIDLTDLQERLENVSPEGLTIQNIEVVNPRSPALQRYIRSAYYRIEFIDSQSVDVLQAKIADLLAQETIVKTKLNRRKKRKMAYDIRPLIYDVWLEDGMIWAHLSVGEGGNLRPDELLEALGLQDIPARIHRSKLEIDPIDEHY
jgi:radical SAM-linked protein